MSQTTTDLTSWSLSTFNWLDYRNIVKFPNLLMLPYSLYVNKVLSKSPFCRGERKGGKGIYEWVINLTQQGNVMTQVWPTIIKGGGCKYTEY
jgi:hypothetical protein